MRSTARQRRTGRRARAADVALIAGIGALVAAAGVVGVPTQTPAQAAPPDLIPPAAGILPGPAPSDSNGTPGSWGPCVPDDDADDSCSGWLIPPGAVPPFTGTDNAPNVVVGGDFTVPDAADSAAETEGLLVVGGDALFDKAYSVGVVGAGTGVSPAHREDMLIVGGDATVNGATTSVTAFGFDGTGFRTGTIRVGGAQNFQDPTGVAKGTFGQLGSVDSANQDPPALGSQNLLYDDVSVLETDGYTELFGTEGKMARYSQLCYAELSTDTTATQIVNEGGLLDLEHGTVTSDDDGLTLTSDGSGDVVEFQLPATVGSPGQPAEIQVVGVADGATVLINTLDAGEVRQVIGDVSWGATPAEATSNRALALGNHILWNYPFSDDVAVGGPTQFPGSILVGRPTSTFETGFSGTNGRVYTPGDLIHSGSAAQTSGNELHAYPFDGALGCIQTLPGTFSVAKELTGDGADAVPDGTTFSVDWEVTGPDDSPNLGVTGTLDVPADGTAVTGPLDLAEGDEVTVSEPTFPDVDGVDWGTPQISPNPVTIGAQGEVAEVTVTNQATLLRGGFAVTKEVTGDDGSATTTEFTGTWTCDAPNTDGDDTGTWTLADGEQLVIDGFPVGTTCTVTEDPTDDAYGTWDTTIDPPQITITDGDPTATLVTVTNDFEQSVGGFEVLKELTGDGADLVPADTTFTVDWEVTGPDDSPSLGETGTLDVPADGTPVAGPDDLATGSEVTFTEAAPPVVDGITWGDASVAPDPLTIGDGTTATVTVTNEATLIRGGFTITKTVTGDDGAATAEFTGTWTCDAPNTDGDDTGTWTLADGEQLVIDGFPVGTTCTVTEDPTDDAYGTWDTTIDPAGPFVVTEGEANATVVTVTNAFANEVGGFAVAKAVTGDDGATVTDFTVTWTCTAPGGTVTTGSITISGGEESEPVTGLPAGTTCTVDEAEIDDPAGTWTAEVSPSEIVIGNGSQDDVAVVTVTNTFDVAEAGFTLTKTVTGDPGATTTEFTGTWTCDAPNADGEDAGTWTLADGEQLVVDGFPVGTTCTVTEDPTDDAFGTWTTTIDPSGPFEVDADAAARFVTVTNTFVAPTPTPSPSTSTPAPTPSIPTTTPDTSGPLPRTGAEVGGMVLLAVLLVGAGVVALTLRRRQG